ncbi:MAG: formylglycine-generating enzyme family protein [Spirochaetaceae bacterium]|nr:formylglycine-generating enzyme family protein [Spirochaetaceae bacterium]
MTILPYTGEIGGDEEAVTSLLSRHEDLHKAFSMTPCDTNFIELAAELESGDFMQESDIIAEIKNRLNADFVLIVRTDKIGNSNLALLSMIDAGTLRQTAGYSRKYGSVRDIRSALPDITKRTLAGAQTQPDLEKISILPFHTRAENIDADILFQLLNTELTNNGKYAVYPWAMVVDNLTTRRNIRSYYGILDRTSLRDFGKDTGIRYVLTGDVLNLGNANLFMASMLTTEDPAALPGGNALYTTGNVEYASIPNSLEDISRLAKILSGGTAPAAAAAAEPSPAADALPSFPEPVAAKVTQAPASPMEFYEIYESPPLIYADPILDPPAEPARTAPHIAQTPEPRQTVPAGPRDTGKPSLTILPFGDKIGDDEETVTILLANQEELRNAFSVIPSDTNFDALMQSIGSQRYASSKAFSDALRDRLKADFALLVRAEPVGAGRIVLISLIRMETLQQISGKYQRYSGVREVRTSLPEIAKTVIADAQKPVNPALPNLTVLPFYTPSGREIKDANILFQYLTIELSNSGKYTVYPWALPIETQVGGLKGAYFGIIDPETIKVFGKAMQMRYVLTGDLLSMGTTNLFLGSIVDTQNATVIREGDLEYRLLMEDMDLVTELAGVLINGKAPPRREPAIAPPAPVAAPNRTPPPATDSAADDRWTEPPKTDLPTAPFSGAQPADPFKDFVKIPAGTFTMGTPLFETGRDPDEIQHSVTVESFYIAKNEVTQAEYEEIMKTNPSNFKQYPNLPVEQVTWFEAAAYCNARSVKEGLTPAYSISGEIVTWNRSANGYRLPTEAEWEYACRAGAGTAFNTGDMFTSQDGNYDGTYPYRNATGEYRERTMPVGSFKPNLWGLYDMHGNVYEWCWDWYEPYSPENTGIVGNRIARGGSWYSALRFLRSGNRIQFAPATKVDYLGFRVARNIPYN